MSQADSVQRHTVTPFLKLPNSERLLEFLKSAFDGIEQGRLLKPDGSVLHAEVIIGDTLLMIHALPSHGTPKPCTLYLRVDDTDATFTRAVAAGATPIFQPTDMYYGERAACVTDVSQNDWWIAACIEKLSIGDIQGRATAFLGERE
jgi:PhnB protein